MPCGNLNTCPCVVVAGLNVTVTGSGTSTDPYVVSSTFVETTFAATSSDLTLSITPGGVAGHNPDLGTRLDPAGNVTLTKTAAGIRADYVPTGVQSVVDTFSVDLTKIGTTLQADVRIDPTSTAPVAITPAGIKIDCCGGGGAITVSDTNSVDMTLVGVNVSADVKINPAGALNITASGLQVRASGTFAGLGYAGADTGGDIVYIDSANQLRTRPRVISAYTATLTVLAPVLSGASSTSANVIINNTSTNRNMRVSRSHWLTWQSAVVPAGAAFAQFDYGLGIGGPAANIFTKHWIPGLGRAADADSSLASFVRFGGEIVAPSGSLTYTVRLNTSSGGGATWLAVAANLSLMGISDN